MRNLTKAQVTRRTAILNGLRKAGIATPNALQQFLAGRWHIYVTEDTVSRDLRAMTEVGTVVRGPHPTARHTWGGGRFVRHTGWSIAPTTSEGA